MWIIYKHTNIINNKSYIGLTQQSLNKRWQNGKGYDKRQEIFYKAIQKYGWENFSHEILEENITSLEEANNREKYWIAFYHTYIEDPDCWGYNMTPGGDCSACSFETRLKISKALLGKPKSELHKQHCKESHPDFSGEKNPFYGKHHSEKTKAKILSSRAWYKPSTETCQKISNAAKGRNLGGCYITDGKIDKFLTAEEKNTLLEQYLAEGWTLGRCEAFKNKFKGRQGSEAQKKAVQLKLSIKVQCIETGIVYNSVSAAKQATGCCHISACCKSGKSDKGLHWKYFQEEN